MSWKLEPPRKMPWMDRATCTSHDPEDFFPHGTREMKQGDLQILIDATKAICRRCPVIAECTDYAIQMQPSDGIWAGMEPREIANLKRTRTRSR